MPFSLLILPVVFGSKVMSPGAGWVLAVSVKVLFVVYASVAEAKLPSSLYVILNIFTITLMVLPASPASAIPRR